MSKKICIYGAGGFGREILCCVIDAFGSKGEMINDLACFMDDIPFEKPILMGVDCFHVSSFKPDQYEVVLGAGDPTNRQKMAASLPGAKFITILHPTVTKSQWVEIGKGSVITAGCVLTCNIKIGDHSQLNLLTTVGHDCVIGNFFTTAPSVNVSGNCIIGDNVYLGTNACVKQGIKICDNVTIGMGAVVVKDIIEPGTYIGIPAKKC